jgi:hypothetical protein
MIDQIVLERLRHVQPNGNEGALFCNGNHAGAKIQQDFVEKIIRELKPRHVVEIGTNKAFFDYFLLTIDENIFIDTFDIAPIFSQGVDILNSLFNFKIKFHLGDSKKTFAKFGADYQVDLAYIDGGHGYPECISDLLNCERLEIPFVLVDDCKLIEDVLKAVQEMIDKFGWIPILKTEEGDDRGMVLLERGEQ